MRKKLSITLAAMFIAALGYSQELTSKKGEAYLPAEGDWALGIDVAPILGYVGNAFNGNTNNASPTFDFVDNSLAVYGKWFRADDMAWRIRLRFLGLNSQSNSAWSPEVGSTTGAQVEDVQDISTLNTTLGWGIEKRRGSTRLQGLYGAEAMLSFGSSSETYTYGNDHTGAYSNFGSNDGGTYRITERDYGTTFAFGVRPFIGVEYFFMPKVSLAGEFGWTLAFTSNSGATETQESLTDGSSTTVNLPTNNSGSFTMDNDNLNGAIRLMFHF